MVDAAETFVDAVRAELRDAREASGLSFEELGSRAGILRGSLFRYLNGNGALPIQAMFRICAGLALPPASLMTRAEIRAASAGKDPEVDPSMTPRELGRRLSLLANVLSNGGGPTALSAVLPKDLGMGRGEWLTLAEGRSLTVPDVQRLSKIAEAVGVPMGYLTESSGSAAVTSIDARLEFIRSMQTNEGGEPGLQTKITPAMLRVMTEAIKRTA